MKKRLGFYFIQIAAVLIIIYISVFIYFKNIESVNAFILERKGNFILIFFLVIILANLFDLGAFTQGFIRKEYNIVQDVLKIFGKVFFIILIVSFIEYFVFFSTKIGRVIYVEVFFLLSSFFIVESLFINFVILSKKQKILWLSSIPANEVEKDYLLGINNKEISNKVETKSDRYELVIYDYPPKGHVDVNNLLNTIISVRNPVDLITYVEEKSEIIPLKYVDELWLLKNIRTYEGVYDKLKRPFNIIFSLVLLMILFLPAFVFALAHKIGSKGRIFFIQRRAGYKGQAFNLIKFRTMVTGAEKDGPKFAEENDARITKIGKFMRIFRIDEVPQLINVLKGDMNLIGPRPERDEFIGMLEKKIPYYKLRLEVRPGLTGWAQVNYPYAGSDINDHLKKLEYDLYYIKNRSFSLDILIVLKTIKTMLLRKGK